MRLGVEIATCTQARTGVGYYTEHLVDALLETRAAGDEVVLLSNKAPSPELASRWSARLHVGGRSMRAAWMQWDVPRLITETRVDVAVFPNYVVPLASPCPSIVVVHDLTVLRMPQYCTLRKRLLMRLMLRHSIAAAAVVATVSEASKRDIEAFLGVSPERIALLPGAAHPSCRRATPEAVADVRARYGLANPYVLTVGTLEPRKDLLTLLRAFDELGPRAQGRQLVVVGGRGWRDRQLVRELKARTADQRVRWLGYVNEPDLVALYSGADLFVLASTLEGFGLPVLEALACGTPVVASDVSALREVGGDVARFVPPGNVAAFAGAIEDALHDPQCAIAARDAGPVRASHFSWTRTAEALWARARVTGPTRVWASVNGAAPRRGFEALPPPLNPSPAGMTAREWALFATVVYADLFDSALPLQRALTSCLGLVLDEPEVRRLARGPALSPLLTLHPAGFLVLRGREHLVEVVPEREARTRTIVERSRPTLSILSALPFVRALVTSGGVVHRNAGARPDVDLFVVTARDRVYTAYSLLVLTTKLTGTRHLICPNYLVDESELAISYHRDLFTAHQLVSARPLYGETAYTALCRANEG
ncbi:MAG TPA: glycosyltransferase family 1 protein, partial [Polyangiaceae bacterium]|nr:glycosyltransferase family 1 protein [Polyangiaceae bacterium]